MYSPLNGELTAHSCGRSINGGESNADDLLVVLLVLFLLFLSFLLLLSMGAILQF